MEIALKVLLIELTILTICFITMLVVRLWRYFHDKGKKKREEKLRNIFTQIMQKKEVVNISKIPRKLRHIEDLLPVIETFDRFFQDSIWELSKQSLLQDPLEPIANRLLKSSSWQKRQMGLRCIALSPQQFLNEKLVVPLLNDPKFLVRIVAALCMVKSERTHLLLPVIKQMIKESKLSRYPYRDILVHSGNTVYLGLEEIAGSEKDPEIIAVCLDALSTKISRNLLPLAIENIDSSNLDCRLAAIKIFSNIPSPESQHYLSSCLGDSNKEIRLEAVRGLGIILAYSCISKIREKLEDKEWFVRLQAALALKSLGKKGREVLSQQSMQTNPQAYEIANYVLYSAQ